MSIIDKIIGEVNYNDLLAWSRGKGGQLRDLLNKSKFRLTFALLIKIQKNSNPCSRLHQMQAFIYLSKFISLLEAMCQRLCKNHVEWHYE